MGFNLEVFFEDILRIIAEHSNEDANNKLLQVFELTKEQQQYARECDLIK